MARMIFLHDYLLHLKEKEVKYEFNKNYRKRIAGCDCITNDCCNRTRDNKYIHGRQS